MAYYTFHTSSQCTHGHLYTGVHNVPMDTYIQVSTMYPWTPIYRCPQCTHGHLYTGVHNVPTDTYMQVSTMYPRTPIYRCPQCTHGHLYTGVHDVSMDTYIQVSTMYQAFENDVTHLVSLNSLLAKCIQVIHSLSTKYVFNEIYDTEPKFNLGTPVTLPYMVAENFSFIVRVSCYSY